jgi:hypothetical protein
MSNLTQYQVDHLFLLIGGNPLPNYVAAHLLARPADTTITLVASRGVEDQCDALHETLAEKGFQHIKKSSLVEEANPHNIYNTVRDAVATCQGTIGLHYTGGTKAMATHAYLAVKENVERDRVFYSYLDARKLELVIEGPGITGCKTVPVGEKVSLKVDELLKLHRLSDLKQPMRRESIWPNVTQALATIHSRKSDAERWRAWCEETLRRKEDRRKFINPTTMKPLRTDRFPFESVQAALAQELPQCSFPATFEAIANALPFKEPFSKADNKMAQWLDGGWLEDYTFQQIHQIQAEAQLNDLVMTINPKLGGVDFEFDVACVRGYQLFALSCTTTAEPGLCKSKLFEAYARAEQIGGSEARIGLVAGIDEGNKGKLEQQLNGLVDETRIRIFGMHDLLSLKDRLDDWFYEA